MEKTLRELAEYLQGTLENEDQKLIVTGVNGLVEAGPQDISFAVPPHVEHCHLSKAGVMVILNRSIVWKKSFYHGGTIFLPWWNDIF